MAYSKKEHIHRYASWCAGTAATTTNCRFKVKVAKELIEDSGLVKMSSGMSSLVDSKKFDDWHFDQRKKLIMVAKSNKGVKGKFTHGVAAKIINIYLKTIFVAKSDELTRQEKSKIDAIHPPIDRTLLKNLCSKDGLPVFRQWKKDFKAEHPTQDAFSWTLYGNKEYEEVINIIKNELKGGELWRIEEYFKGYQE